MAVIRVEPVKDEASGLYYIEIYNPQDASAPFVTTEPRYMTAAAAEKRRHRDDRRGNQPRRVEVTLPSGTAGPRRNRC